MNPHTAILDTLVAFLERAPRNPDGTLTDQARQDVQKIVTLADDPDSLADILQGHAETSG